MAFHINAANIEPIVPRDMDIFGQILKGYNFAKEPGRIQRLEEKETLLNKGLVNKNLIEAAEAQHAPEYYMNRAKKGGLDNLHQALVNAYYGRDMESQIGLREAQAAHGGGSRGYAPSPIGKLYNERAAAIEMYGPDSPQAKSYDLVIQKAQSDAGQRKSALNFGNVIQSIENANVDDLVRYSGPKGYAKLKVEEAKDLAGNPSEEYIRYKEAQKIIGIEAQELRQALGTSITKSMDTALRDLVNPTGIRTSPETAKRMILKARALIKKQGETLQKSLISTDPFKQPDGNQNSGADKQVNNAAMSNYLKREIDKSDTVLGSKNGLNYNIPKDRIEAFIASGGIINGR